MLMLNVAAACNFWPLAAKASLLSFTNNFVDEATAGEEFTGFHDNAELMLIFFTYSAHPIFRIQPIADGNWRDACSL